jgi:Surface-adhesin protein E
MLRRIVISTLLTGCVLLTACASTGSVPPFDPPTSPQWVKAYGDMFYYDPVSIEKLGDVRLVWELQDLEEPHEDGTRSRLSLQEFDCANQRVRWGLKFACFTTPMARGDPSCVSDGPLTNWMPLADAKPEYQTYARTICE